MKIDIRKKGESELSAMLEFPYFKTLDDFLNYVTANSHNPYFGLENGDTVIVEYSNGEICEYEFIWRPMLKRLSDDKK